MSSAYSQPNLLEFFSFFSFRKSLNLNIVGRSSSGAETKAEWGPVGFRGTDLNSERCRDGEVLL